MINTPNSSLENSKKPKFSTVKKAIQHSAELLADLDGKKRPKKEHYDKTFEKLREIKTINPETLEKRIIATAQDKDLKDELGPDLYSTFQMVWVKVSTMFSQKIRDVVQQMNNEQDYYPVESREKLLNSLNEIIGEMTIEIRKNPLVRNSFTTEKEKKLLDKAISQATASILAIVPDILTQEERLNKEKKESRIFGYNTADDLKKKLLEEKPSFRTIRKAIKISAEAMASKEFLEAPEQRHIDAILSSFRMLRNLDPKALNIIIDSTVKAKEVSDEMGPDLRAIFDQVWSKELTATMSEDLDAAIAIIHKTKTLSDDDMEKEIIILAKRYLEGKAKQLRQDPRIISAFAGKEALLDKILNFAMSGADIAQSLAEDKD